VNALNLSANGAVNIIEKNKGLFKGIGEIAFEQANFREFSPDDGDFLSFYEAAKKNGLVIMMHPRLEHKKNLEKILAKYPDVKFLFHGSEDVESYILDILRSYKNAYFSLDANVAPIYGFDRYDNLVGESGRQKFAKRFPEIFKTRLENEIKNWKGIIESLPDKFMWGTDRWYSWHFDVETLDYLEEFGRSFIGSLDKSVQEKFAYKNALQLLE